MVLSYSAGKLTSIMRNVCNVCRSRTNPGSYGYLLYYLGHDGLRLELRQHIGGNPPMDHRRVTNE